MNRLLALLGVRDVARLFDEPAELPDGDFRAPEPEALNKRHLLRHRLLRIVRPSLSAGTWAVKLPAGTHTNVMPSLGLRQAADEPGREAHAGKRLTAARQTKASSTARHVVSSQMEITRASSTSTTG